jgi:hypothetical protein
MRACWTAKVLVTWNARHEALFFCVRALPLRNRPTGQVVWSAQAEGAALADVPPATSVPPWRGGVKCEAPRSFTRTRAGRCSRARRVQLGDAGDGFGHSRLREFVLGGASRHVLEHMTIPVLMSH